MCIRCGENETPPDRPYCVHCMSAVRAEVEAGLRRLAEYLGAWAAFDAWCDARHAAAA
jgi:rhodanese-related sulfurtransferase